MHLMRLIGHKAQPFLHSFLILFVILCESDFWMEDTFLLLSFLTLASNATVVFPLFLRSGDAGKFLCQACGL